MSHLSLSVLGAFQATLDNEPISFSSTKARALLVYLAVESGRPHRREILASLLWPERPEHVARNNLRHTLSTLRQSIGDRIFDSGENGGTPVLSVTRKTVQFNCDSDCWMDVIQFQDLLKDGSQNPSFDALNDAVTLYRGDFLEGFYVRDSTVYEDWTILLRDRLHRQVSLALQQLIKLTDSAGNYEDACRFAWRLVELEPWQENAYQLLMRVLALNGERTKALSQYEVCRNILRTEFNVEPSESTIQLYEKIRDDKLQQKLAPAHPVSGAELLSKKKITGPTNLTPASDVPVFVSRASELEQLQNQLHIALEGQGRVVFVVGEAGQGKTMLVHAFIKRIQKLYPSVLVTGGNCNAYTGLGDPYLPFREILELLTGGISKNNGSDIYENESHLGYDTFEVTAKALLAKGRDLINVFIPGRNLTHPNLPCEISESDWYSDLDGIIKEKNQTASTSIQQEDLFKQYTSVLTEIAKHQPLVLFIDDMQWADLGSISLLFHLGRRLSESRILVIGAYRSEEIALGRQDERHPLAPLLSEFKRSWGNNEINLQKTDAKAFIQAYIGSEPNSLDKNFRDTLLHQTGGHPLFTVELLRGMQDRGDLTKDENGKWEEGPKLNWDILPARIEAVIAERINRLSERQVQILRAASVQGEFFNAEVIGDIQSLTISSLVSSLSGDLSRKHRLVRAQGIDHTQKHQISQYRFRHILFQKYIYNNLDEVERSYLHHEVAKSLFNLYEDNVTAITPQLAWHYEQAGMLNEAVDFYKQAGELSVMMSANVEAVLHFNKAISLLNELPHTRERDERELDLQFNVRTPIITLHSWAAPEALQVCERTMELSQSLNDTPRVLQAMMLKQGAHTTRAEHRIALDVSRDFFHLAQQFEDPLQLMLAYQSLCTSQLFVGDFSNALHNGQQLMKLYDFSQHRSLTLVLGQDPAIVSYVTRIYDLWYLGYPDKALELSEEGLVLAQQIDIGININFAICFKSRLHRWRREVSEVDNLAEEQTQMWREYKINMAKAGALLDQAWVLSEQGFPEKAIPMYEEGVESWHATGMLNHRTEFLCVLAEMYGMNNQPCKGLELIDEALVFMENGDERYHEAELYRMRGILLLQLDEINVQQAEAEFLKSIKVARQMKAKSCELRTAISLVRMWLTLGYEEKLQDAQSILSEVYGWFTEGFGTRDLKEARELLSAKQK